MKRRVIAEDRGVRLKSGPLRSTISHYTTDFSLLCNPEIRRNHPEISDHVKTLRQVWISSDC